MRPWTALPVLSLLIAPLMADESHCVRGFAQPLRLAARTDYHWVKYGDLNGDGRMDIVTEWIGPAPLLNRGGLVFDQMPILQLRGDFDPPLEIRAELIDVTGDQIPDLVEASYQTAVARGRGDGTFDPPARLPEMSISYTRKAWVRDLNRDGIAELLSLDGNVLEARTFDGSRLRPPVTTAIPPFAPTTAYYAVGDFDGDGLPDLFRAPGDAVVGGGDPTFYWNNGDLTFKADPQHTNSIIYPVSFIAADVDGDGIPEIIGEGRGGWFIASALQRKVVARLVANPALDRYAPLLSHAVGAADFDLDGYPDIVISELQEVSVFWGGPQGPNGVPTVFDLPGAEDVTIVDLNGDSIPDIATARGNNVVVALGARGRRQFDAGIISHQSRSDVRAATAGDFNEDGHPDLLGSNSEEAVLYLNKGDGTFQQGMFLPDAQPSTLGDFDGDGHLDIAARHRLLFGNGRGGFTTVAIDGDMLASEVKHGKTPMLYAARAGTVQRLTVNHDRSVTFENLGIPAPAYLWSLGMTLDGREAIAINESIYMETSGGWQKIATVTDGRRPIATGDFDHDGRDDILADSGDRFLRNDGSVYVSTVLHGYARSSSTIPHVVDFDGDGTDDIVYTSGPPNGVGYGEVEVWVNDRGDNRRDLIAYAAVGYLQGAVVADFDGDGHPDVVAMTPDGPELLKNICSNGPWGVRAAWRTTAVHPGNVAELVVQVDEFRSRYGHVIVTENGVALERKDSSVFENVPFLTTPLTAGLHTFTITVKAFDYSWLPPLVQTITLDVTPVVPRRRISGH